MSAEPRGAAQGPPVRASAAGDLALLLCAIGWGTTFPLTRLALGAGATPLAFNAARFVIGAVVLVPLALRLGGVRLRAALGPGVLVGALTAAAFWLQAYGLSRIGSTRSAFLTAFYVLFTPPLEWLALRRRPSRALLAGAAVAFGGLAVMAGDVAFAGASLAGDVATLACALVFAIQMVAIAEAVRRVAVGALLCVQIATCGVLSALGALAFETARVPATAPVLGSLAFLSLGATVGILALQAYGQRHTTATRAGVLFSSEPVWAACFAALLGEVISARELGGGALVLAGLVVASLPSSRSRA